MNVLKTAGGKILWDCEEYEPRTIKKNEYSAITWCYCTAL